MKGNTKFKKILGIVIAVLLLGVIYPMLNGAMGDGNNTPENDGAVQVGQDVGDAQEEQGVGGSLVSQDVGDAQGVGGSLASQDGRNDQASQGIGDSLASQNIQNIRDDEPDTDQQDGTEISYTFRNEKYLTEHFQKHGSEFDYTSKEEYEAGANRVIASEEALHKTEAEDGDHIYYLESSNEIVFLSTDGYIRTYFKPRDGIRYYERQ